MSLSTPSQLIEQLAQLLGLDTGSVREQIWPHLSSMKDGKQVATYLDELLGPGQIQKRFIQTYTTSRFAAAAPPPPAQSTLNWNKSNRPTPSNSSSRAPPPTKAIQSNIVEQQRLAAIEREFGGGGKVYMKHREDDFDLGANGGKKSRSGSPSGSGRSTPVSGISSTAISNGFAPSARQSTTLARSLPPAAPSASKKGGGLSGEKELDGVVILSEEASQKLIEIDRNLRTFEKGKGASRECFCQAREHELSRHTPQCPKCALVLCTLNLPTSPCPSCSHHPLLSPLLSASFIADLHSQRDLIIQSETLRLAREKVQEAKEKAAIRFPTLGGASDGVRAANTGIGGTRGYANIAGAGPDLNERIATAYEEGRSLNGKTFGKKPEVEESAPRVLKLDMKTKKVKIQTKIIKKKVIVEKEEGKEVAEIEVEDGDDRIGWTDENDDGVRARTTTKSKETISTAPPPDRPFYNSALAASERPIWTEKRMIEYVDNSPIPTAVVDAPRGIPGAAVKVEGEKKKGRPKVKKGVV